MAPTTASAMTTEPEAGTPPLLTLPPVLLIQILLHVEAPDIVATQALLTKHPALACLEKEGEVGGLWAGALQQLRRQSIVTAREFFALTRPPPVAGG